MSPSFAELKNEKQKDRASQLQYLASLKTDRVEGMIIEHEAESVFFTRLNSIGWRLFSSKVLFCGGRIDGHYRKWFTIVYEDASDSDDCKIVESALVKTGYPVRLLDVRGDNPKYWHAPDGSRLSKPVTLKFTKTVPAKENVIDWARVNSVFWGYAIHNRGLVERFVSETLLKDHFLSEGLEPGDKPKVYISDVDALLIGPNEEISVIEIKHKRRTKNGEIGLNKHPRAMAESLICSGSKFIYLILEKPPSRPKSTMYLYFDRKDREQAEWIGCNVTASDLGGDLQNAPAHTAIGGHRGVTYVPIPVERFSSLGKNYEKSAVLQTSFSLLLTSGP